MRRLVHSSALAGLILVAAACGDAPSSPSRAASTGTAVPSATPSKQSSPAPTPTTGTPTPTPTPPPSAEPSTCGSEGATSYEAAAACVYAAFLGRDREAAAVHASPAAVETLFSLGSSPTDGQWSFDGCGQPSETTPSSGVSCQYSIPAEIHGVVVEMAMAQDRSVESITTIG